MMQMPDNSNGSLSTVKSTNSTAPPLKKRSLLERGRLHEPTNCRSNKSDEKVAAAAALASLCESPNIGRTCSNRNANATRTTFIQQVQQGQRQHEKSNNADDKKAKSATDEADTHPFSSTSHSLAFPKLMHAPPKSKTKVDHTYSDYSAFDEECLGLLEKNSDLTTKSDYNMSSEQKEERDKSLAQLKLIFGDAPTRKNSGGVVQPFPEKLMEVLDRGDMEHIVRWMPHGRSFLVLHPQSFVKEVLPRFFKQSKFMSFTRQLNLWGFKRITKGTESGSYYHELFLRGRPRLCMKMRRQKIKGTGIKLTPSPHTEPNFYKISEKRPLPPVNVGKKIKPLPPLPPLDSVADNVGSGKNTTLLSVLPLPVDELLGKNLASSHRPNPLPMQNRSHYHHHHQADGRRPPHPSSLLFTDQRAATLLRPNHLPQDCADSIIPPPPPLPTSSSSGGRLSNGSILPRGFVVGGELEPETMPSLPLSRTLNSSPFRRMNIGNYSGGMEQELSHASCMGAMYPYPEGDSLAILREQERNEQEQHEIAVQRAKRLLEQMNADGRIHDVLGPGSSPSSIDILKQQLLAAADSLGHGGERDGLHHHHRSSAIPTSTSQVPVTFRRDVSALMSALEYTQQVAEAAQHQSVMLSRFARDLSSSAPPPGGVVHPGSSLEQQPLSQHHQSSGGASRRYSATMHPY